MKNEESGDVTELIGRKVRGEANLVKQKKEDMK